MDRSPLTLAEKNIKELQGFIDSLREVGDESEEAVRITEILEWHMGISKMHYRNLLHCYNIGEKTKVKTEV